MKIKALYNTISPCDLCGTVDEALLMLRIRCDEAKTNGFSSLTLDLASDHDGISGLEIWGLRDETLGERNKRLCKDLKIKESKAAIERRERKQLERLKKKYEN